MLTGDQLDTGISIGYSSRLIDSTMLIVEIKLNDFKSLEDIIEEGISMFNNSDGLKKCVIITGEKFKEI